MWTSQPRRRFLGPSPIRSRTPNGSHSYQVEVKNFSGETSVVWAPSFLSKLWPAQLGEGMVTDKWMAMDFPTRIAYVLGWRHLAFWASIRVSNGKVSEMGYWLLPDVFVGWPASYFVSAQTVRGYLRAHHIPIQVASVGEESPDFRFGEFASQFSWLAGADRVIAAVAYTPTAPPDMVAHLFQRGPHLLLGERGCDSVRQVVPLLWQDRERLVRRPRRVLHPAILARTNSSPGGSAHSRI